jgi:hypothetical protein
MAILIEKSMNVMGDIPISEIYCRIQYLAEVSGKYLMCSMLPYYNKESFLSGPNENILNIDGLKINYNLAYDSSLNGNNALQYIHESIKTELSTDLSRSEIVLDPSTGSPVIDPSTGGYVYEEVIVTPKFAMDSSISFADLD